MRKKLELIPLLLTTILLSGCDLNIPIRNIEVTNIERSAEVAESFEDDHMAYLEQFYIPEEYTEVWHRVEKDSFKYVDSKYIYCKEPQDARNIRRMKISGPYFIIRKSFDHYNIYDNSGQEVLDPENFGNCVFSIDVYSSGEIDYRLPSNEVNVDATEDVLPNGFVIKKERVISEESGLREAL